MVLEEVDSGRNLGPAWIDAFLGGKYFTGCHKHVGGKNDRNHFCTKCCEGPLCNMGILPHSSAGHATLQVRKASHMDSIRVVDISKVLEVGDIQTYSINSAKIVFLLSRPQPRPSKSAPHICLCCRRPLPDALRFCSLACKLNVLRQGSLTTNDDITFTLQDVSNGSTTVNAPSGNGFTSSSCEEQRSCNNKSFIKRKLGNGGSQWSLKRKRQNHSLLSQPITPEKSSSVPICRVPISRRKGVPHRAPFK